MLPGDQAWSRHIAALAPAQHTMDHKDIGIAFAVGVVLGAAVVAAATNQTMDFSVNPQGIRFHFGLTADDRRALALLLVDQEQEKLKLITPALFDVTADISSPALTASILRIQREESCTAVVPERVFGDILCLRDQALSRLITALMPAELTMDFKCIGIAFTIGFGIGALIVAAAKNRSVDFSVNAQGIRFHVGEKEKALAPNPNSSPSNAVQKKN